MLSAVGMFEELEGRRFQNNELSKTLLSGVAGSVRDFARWYGVRLHWNIWSNLGFSVQTGKPASKQEHPDKDVFEVLAADPKAQRSSTMR